MCSVRSSRRGLGVDRFRGQTPRMTPPRHITSGLSPAEREQLINFAADALRNGRLVIIPTETVYGLAANARSPVAIQHLARLTGRAGPWAWHVASGEEACTAIEPESSVHIRLMRRLLPGPVAFLFELQESKFAAIRSRIDVPAGVLDGSDGLLVRAPDHALTQAIISRAGVPIVADSIAAVVSGTGARVPDDLNRPNISDIALIVDDGPTRFGKPATVVRLRADGGYAVASVGAMEARFVDKQLDRMILFVCTGNTCRSPMAAAIARDWLARETPSGVRTRVKSAGVAAATGHPATPEAIESLRRLGIQVERHSSSELTRDMVAEADAIFVMTQAHARAVLAMDPTAVGRVHMLAGDGEAIADPIGGTQAHYDATAEQIRTLVARRLKELAP